MYTVLVSFISDKERDALSPARAAARVLHAAAVAVRAPLARALLLLFRGAADVDDDAAVAARLRARARQTERGLPPRIYTRRGGPAETRCRLPLQNAGSHPSTGPTYTAEISRI